MRLVVQRVSEASVTSDGEVVGAIGPGLVVLAGVTPGDGELEATMLAEKTVGLRIFSDEEGRMNRSVLDSGGGVLVVSQFTLYGDARKGRRPSFTDAAAPEVAEEVISRFCDEVRARGVDVATGRFQTAMRVSLVNDGPVTIILEAVDGRFR